MKNISSFALLGVLFNLLFFALLSNCGTSKGINIDSYYEFNMPDGTARIDTFKCVGKNGEYARFQLLRNGKLEDAFYNCDLRNVKKLDVTQINYYPF